MKTAWAILLIITSATSFAFKNEPSGKLYRPEYRTAAECKNRPEFLSEVRSDFFTSFRQLPPVVLVARQAEYYIEGRDSKSAVKMYGVQSFTQRNKDAKVVCAHSAESVKQRFSIYAPTLLDTHGRPEVEQSLWQFQMMRDENKYSFWNLKSPAMAQGGSLESWLKDSGGHYKIYQRSHDEFELLVIKKSGNLTQYLSIRYDAVPHLSSL